MVAVVQAREPAVVTVGGGQEAGEEPDFLTRLSPRVIEVLGLALALGLIVTATLNRRLSTDVFWSLAAGQSILAHHSLFGVDAFTYTEPHRRWVADEWGSEVILASLFKAFGTAAYNLFSIGTGFAILLCTRAYVRALGARGGRLALITVLLAVGLLGVVTQDRGLSFSLMWLPLELLILTKARANSRWLWWLVPLFVLWANTHGSVLLGLLVLVVALLWSGLPQQRLPVVLLQGRAPSPGPLALATLGAVGAACVNPYGPGLLAYDLRVTFNGQIGQYIEEWGSPNFHSFTILLAFCVPLAVLVFAIWSRRMPVLELSLTILFVLATLHSTRFVAYLFIGACGLAAGLPQRGEWGGRARRVVGALSVAVLIGMLAAPTVPAGSVTSDTPVAAFNYLASHPGRIFTQYTWADYSIARHRATFVDGRTDYFTGTALTQYFAVQNVTADPDVILSHYEVSYVVWPQGAALSTFLSRDPAWKVVDRTNVAIVFARRGLPA